MDHPFASGSVFWRKNPATPEEVEELLRGHLVENLTDPVALYGASLVYIKGSPGTLNEGRNILWAAACLGSAKAAGMLSAEIGDHLRGDDVNPAPGYFEAMTERMSYWIRESKVPAVNSPGMISETPSGKVVIPAIGDHDSREGRELSSRFRHVIGRELPWVGVLPECDEIKGAILEKWPWAETAAEAIEVQIDISRLARESGGRNGVRIRPLLFCGPPSSGKTGLARAVFDMLKLPSKLVPCAGTADSGGLSPVSRGWSTMRPSAPVVFMAERGVCNPGVILDEIDKSLGVSAKNGSVIGAVMGMLGDPDRYFDACLMAETDLSGISFVATANNLSALPDFMKERFTLITVDRPGPEHFETIFQTMKEITARDIGVSVSDLPFLDSDEMAALKSFFVKNRASLRALREAYDLTLSSAIRRTSTPTLN